MTEPTRSNWMLYGAYGTTGRLILGISIGGTITLQSLDRDCDGATAVVAVSPDSRTAGSDAAAYAFLQAEARRTSVRRLRRRVMTLGEPPYLDAAGFQRRASLLADLGTIERGKTFNAILRELLVALIRTYGLAGAIAALRNMNIVQRKLLPDIASLDLLAHPPRVTIPVHYVFGDNDALTAASTVQELPAAIGAPGTTVVRMRDAGHMAHFDQPDLVRSIVRNA